MAKFKYLKKEGVSKLPKSAGVYVLKKGREFLYIGKASNIKERVKNHFQQPAYRDNLFLNQVEKIGYLKTDSEIEALILEAHLIKKHQPRFNVIWRDDKNYFFVGMTKEDFPRIFWTHQTKLKPKTYNLEPNYIGPFVDGKALKQTLKILRKIFPYRTCKTIPKGPCLWYQLNRCPAPCLLKSKLAKQLPKAQTKIKNECKENAKSLMKILQGKKKQVLRDLKKRMKEMAKIQNFERAAKIRDQIEALEKTLFQAKILQFTQIEYALPWRSPLFSVWKDREKKLRKILKTKRKIERIEAYDVSNIHGKEATGSMVTFIKGEPDKNFYRRFKVHLTPYAPPIRAKPKIKGLGGGVEISGKPNDLAMLKEILERRFSRPEWGLPDLILVDGGRAQLKTAIDCVRCHLAHILNQHKSAKSALISVMALAKKKNELFIGGTKKPILLKDLPREIFNLILQMRDEAHRFAIKYHKKLRAEALFD